MKNITPITLFLFVCFWSLSGAEPMHVSLNGKWLLAETIEETQPEHFNHTVAVPGYVDQAVPVLKEVGVESTLRNYFWLKKNFVTPKGEFSNQHIRFLKAKYGLKAWLNGELLGEHLYNFTATEFDVSAILKPAGETNELVVRLMAHTSLLPPEIVSGFDPEKVKYIPGIYDNVELDLSNGVTITNLQIVPDIENNEIEVIHYLERGDETNQELRLSYRIYEDNGNKLIQKGRFHSAEAEPRTVIRIPDAKRWTPESPVLYRIEVESDGDMFSARFGMREFQFNPDSGFAELNGDTYFLRGTNICIFRFEDDDLRTNQFWVREWAKALLLKTKEMNWNSLRFCISFPPDFWYDLCDEIGILVQDEYPIFYGARAEDFPQTIKAEGLAQEYAEWMRGRWNHPSVVIWDAQNESVTAETGKAIQMVRHLDESNRPWDNGYSRPQSRTDPIECHPYVFDNYFKKGPSQQGVLFDNVREKRHPFNGPSERDPLEDGSQYENPVINNESVMLWIDRSGRATYLVNYILDKVIGEHHRNMTADEYYEYYGYHFNRLMTYWRAHRTSAAVQEFCLLGYSRNDLSQEGYTSDNFSDVNTLTFRPHYKEYAYPAFYPLGLLIDRWEILFNPSQEIDIPLIMFNDRKQNWNGKVSVSITDRQRTESFEEKETIVEVDALGQTKASVMLKLPEKVGDYQFVATYTDRGETIVQTHWFSVTDVELDEAIEMETGDEIFIHSTDGKALE